MKQETKNRWSFATKMTLLVIIILLLCLSFSWYGMKEAIENLPPNINITVGFSPEASRLLEQCEQLENKNLTEMVVLQDGS